MEKSTQISLRAFNLNQQDITAYDFGEYTVYGNRWVEFGKNNDYPNFLRNLYINSPTHQAIMDGVINLSTGDGVALKDPVNNPISNKFLTNNFTKDVIHELISDLKQYGYCVLRVYPNGGIIQYDNADKYRMAEENKEGTVKTIWFSNNWMEYNDPKNRPVEIPLLGSGIESELYIAVCQMDKKGFKYYAPVDYSGSINWINLEVEISKFHLSSILNGLFPNIIINYPGVELSNEQLDEIEFRLNKKYGGSLNASKLMISNSPTKDTEPTITTIDQPQLSERYEFLSKECSEKILLGHGVTSPLLFGIRDTGGGFGNNADELEKSYQLFYEGKLKGYQNYIIELITEVMNSFYLYAEVIFKPYNPFVDFKQTTQKLSKIKQELNEINISKTLKLIDDISIENKDITILNDNIFDGIQKENCLYKFNRSSLKQSLLINKFIQMDRSNYLFKYDKNLIKNTEDYYFTELFILKNKNK